MRVLIISVHPDDEAVGCGGTMLKHRADGDTLSWLIITSDFEPEWSRAVIEQKATEVEAVAARVGMEPVIKLGLPTTRMETVSQRELMAQIRAAIEQVKPDTVYLVNRSDVHSDHR